VLRQFEVPYQQFDSPWTWVEDYVYRDGVLLAAERVPAQGGRRYFHTDHLGTPRLITDSSGRRISEHDYFPFGVDATPLRQDTLSANGFNREEPMKFTGHERDFMGGTSFENSNYVDYMHARSTVPQWGRFLSVDPTWDSADRSRPQSWNRYAYVRNNPINLTDPDGRDGKDYAMAAWATFAEFFVDYVLLDGQGLDPDPPPSRAAIAAAAAGIVNLEQRAKQIHGGLSPDTQRRTTTAVAEVTNADGTKQTLVASSEKRLRPAQLKALGAGETALAGAGHAEQTIIKAATASGQTVERVAASRPICPECAVVIERAGAKAVSVLKRLIHSVF
jgi:RHS repeat-associated protein